MREPTEKEIHIISRLLYIFDLTSKNYPDWDGDQIKEYIDNDEWGIAANCLAFHYLPGKFALTESIFNIFSDLSECMEVQEDDFFQHLQLLLKTPPPLKCQCK